MDTTVVATTSESTIHFLNIEYFFRLLYELLYGHHLATLGVSGGLPALFLLASHIWLAVTILAWIFSLFCIWVLIYYTLRYWQVKKEDEERYKTISEPEAHVQVEHSRWAYIKQLIESPQETDWRQAIIEADIMLDEMLARIGYVGNGIGEKLKTANFGSLQNAWDAHKVRNEIAHQGSQYQLSNHIAYRTIANYEAVFREFNEI